MPTDELIELLNRRLAYLEQKAEALEANQLVLELDLALYKSRDQRQKSAWDYLEEAVADEFGIEVRDLMRKPSKPGPPKGNVNNVLTETRKAQYVLFAMLMGLVGVKLNDIRQYYGSFVATYTAFWGELFNLVHKPRELSGREQHTWDMYAPKFIGVYSRWKAAMIADGCWLDQYEIDQPLEVA